MVFLLFRGFTGSPVTPLLAVRSCLQVFWLLHCFLRLWVRTAAGWAERSPLKPRPTSHRRSPSRRRSAPGPSEGSGCRSRERSPPEQRRRRQPSRSPALPRSPVPRPRRRRSATRPALRGCGARGFRRFVLQPSARVRGRPPRARPPEQAASRRPGRATEGPGGGVSGARPRHHMMPLLLPAVPPRKGNWARGRGSGPLSPPQPQPLPIPLPLPRRRRPPPLPSARGRAGSAAGHGRAAGVAAAELRADRRPRLQPGRRAAGRVLGRRGQLLRLRRGLLRSRRLLVSARPRGPSAPQRVWSASSRGSAARQPSCPHSRALRHPRYVNPAELVIN